MALTTISPGVDTGFSTKLNNNFDWNQLHVDTIESSVEETTTSTTYVDTDCTETITGLANSLLMSVFVEASISNTDQAYISSAVLEASGATLGTVYLNTCNYNGSELVGVKFGSSASTIIQTTTGTTGYVTRNISGSYPLALLDDSIKFTLKVKTNNASSTAAIKGMVVKLLYTKGCSID